MARRLVNTVFTSADETDWTLELWDMALNSASLDYTVEMDVNGFQITWNGDEMTYFSRYSLAPVSLQSYSTRHNVGL